jgi:predicted DNA-binding transcriptional regulator YafY
MRASRLLSILMLLQTRGRMSAEALAAEVEVSVRTIYRDVDQLSAAGVPVYAERGRTGGFALLDGWRTRLTGLTAPEAQALFLAGLPGPASQLGLGEAMAAAQLKLLAALPAGWQEDARRVGARFHLDPVDWYRSAPPADHLPAVAAGVWSERRLRIRYERWSGIVERIVDPLGLVLKAGIWYLVAAVGGAPRTYRVSNILALATSDESFVRPRDFDLKAYWAQSTESFEAGLYRGAADLRVSPRGLAMLRGSTAAVADAIQRTSGPADNDGRVGVSIPIESIEHAAQQILPLGTHAEVIGPPALRRRVGEIVRALAAVYRGKTAHSKR